MSTIKPFDNYEISGCRRYKDDGDGYVETVDTDAEAAFWTLYGHTQGEGVIAIGDFSTRAAAEEVYAKIVGEPFTASYAVHPPLRLRHAAADLLAALHGCLFALDAHADGFGPTRQQAIQRARAAIATATEG